MFMILTFFAFSGLQNVCAKETGDKKDKPKPTLTIYNWVDYLGPDTVKNFEAETGIKVIEVHFEDEEEIMGAIISEPTGYDLVVLSGDLQREMAEAKMLAKLDYKKLPNFKHIGQAYKNMHFDPQQLYTVPYMLGTTGFVFNKKYVPEDTDSWKVLFNEKYNGRIAMLNNVYECGSVAAKLLGYSINTLDRAELAQMTEMLLKQKPLVKGYIQPDKLLELIVDETLWVAHLYSGEASEAMDANENLAYVIPKEGATMWMDCFAIPKHSQHKEEAYQFLDYILRPEINAAIASYLWQQTPNITAKQFMDEEVLASPEVYPSDTVMARCEYYANIEAVTDVYVRLWRDLQLDN